MGIFVRVASGGGTLRGVGYVLTTEEPIVVALVAAGLVVSIVAIAALLRDASWMWPVSVAGACLALATSVVLALGGHDSGFLSALVSSVLLGVGLATGRAPA